MEETLLFFLLRNQWQMMFGQFVFNLEMLFLPLPPRKTRICKLLSSLIPLLYSPSLLLMGMKWSFHILSTYSLNYTPLMLYCAVWFYDSVFVHRLSCQWETSNLRFSFWLNSSCIIESFIWFLIYLLFILNTLYIYLSFIWFFLQLWYIHAIFFVVNYLVFALRGSWSFYILQ